MTTNLMDDMEERWAFVVDTDQYPGNFEVELCAYVTGAYAEGQEHRAKAYVDEFDKIKTHDLEDLTDIRVCDPGDDALWRSPCDLALTPGRSNNGQWKCYYVTAKKPFRYYAYESVAIFLCHRPTDDVFDLLVRRAFAFSKLRKFSKWDERPKILRCRLVKETVITTTEQTVSRPPKSPKKKPARS